MSYVKKAAHMPFSLTEDTLKQTSLLYNLLCIELGVFTLIVAIRSVKKTTVKVKNPKSKSLYKFQKEIMLSNPSLICLFQMLQKLYDVKYILTHRLNQDCLEHFFGCIRQ